jgi:hypothetical protein
MEYVAIGCFIQYIQPTRSHVANFLGLVYAKSQCALKYIKGPKKAVRFGNQEIHLKPTTPKNMIGTGTKAGLILRAVRKIGKENISDEMIEHIQSQLEARVQKQIKKQAQYAPE